MTSGSGWLHLPHRICRDDSTGAVYELAAASFVGAGVGAEAAENIARRQIIGNGPLVIDELMAVYISWMYQASEPWANRYHALRKRKPVVCRC